MKLFEQYLRTQEKLSDQDEMYIYLFLCSMFHMLVNFLTLKTQITLSDNGSPSQCSRRLR